MARAVGVGATVIQRVRDGRGVLGPRQVARRGADLAEERRRRAAYEAQASADAREREALAASVRALEAIVASRSNDRKFKGGESQTATLVAEREAELAVVRDELRLERNLVDAVRQQVDAAEAERVASSSRIDALRARLAVSDEGGATDREGASETMGASWEALLHQQVRALEHGLAARDEEVSTLRAELNASRAEMARLSDNEALTAAGY